MERTASRICDNVDHASRGIRAVVQKIRVTQGPSIRQHRLRVCSHLDTIKQSPLYSPISQIASRPEEE